MPPKKSSGSRWTAQQKIQVFKWLRDNPGMDVRDISSFLIESLPSRSRSAIESWIRNVKKKTIDYDNVIRQLQCQIGKESQVAVGGGSSQVLFPEIKQITDMLQGMTPDERSRFLQHLRSFDAAGGGASTVVDRYEGLNMAQKMLMKSLQDMAKDANNRSGGQTAQQYVRRQFALRTAFKFSPTDAGSKMSSASLGAIRGGRGGGMSADLLGAIRGGRGRGGGGAAGGGGGSDALLAKIRALRIDKEDD